MQSNGLTSEIKKTISYTFYSKANNFPSLNLGKIVVMQCTNDKKFDKVQNQSTEL